MQAITKATPELRAELEGASSAEIVFRGVVHGLYEGRYVPGQRLAEADLTNAYGVSRGSVREALNRLAADGIVTLNLHRGAQIRSLTRKDVNDILAVLELMVGLAGRLAAEKIGDGDNRGVFETALQELLSHRSQSRSYEFIRARNRLYRVLVEIGDNRELARMLRTIQVHLVRVQWGSEQVEASRFADYRAMGRAVLTGDQAGAERACRRHIQRVAIAINELSDTAFEPS